MPYGLKNLGASAFRHFWKGERLRVTGASEKCIVTKKHATNLQNSDALCSQTCTFAMGPGSGCLELKIASHSRRNTSSVMKKSHLKCQRQVCFKLFCHKQSTEMMYFAAPTSGGEAISCNIPEREQLSRMRARSASIRRNYDEAYTTAPPLVIR